MTPAFAPVIAEQARIRHDDLAALQRRDGLRRARRRCEDLTELLGALDARQSPAVTAQLRAAARDLYGLVAGPQLLPLRQRRRQAGSRASRQEITTALPDLVEQLDEALYDVRSGFRGSRRVALDLAAVVVAGVEALTSAGG
jgi:hypothetical protein